MSSQGSSIANAEIEIIEALLEAWGRWSRSGSLGLDFNGLDIWAKSGLGCMFSDDQMLEVDQAVATSGPYFKRILIKFYIHEDRADVDGNDLGEAIASVSERLRGDVA